MKTYTDFPITELGDNEFTKAPIRECEVLSYDDERSLYIKVENVFKTVKRSFVYTKEGRFTEVESITDEEINFIIANSSYTKPEDYKPSFSNIEELKQKPIEEQIKHILWSIDNDPQFENLISDKQFDNILKSVKRNFSNFKSSDILWRDADIINLLKNDLI